VQPTAANVHHFIASNVQRRLYEAIPDDWGIYQRLGAAVPSRPGLYVPDLMVVPRETLREGDDEYFIPASSAELVVEITSKATADHDRFEKAAGYAGAGIPLYLLIDLLAPDGPASTLYGEPAGGVYRLLQAGRFGMPIWLPEPFGLALDTGDFPSP
jgi:Uma2 family endonuclease